MPRKVSLGKPVHVLGLGAGLKDPAGGICKCGRFSTELVNALCPFCRAGNPAGVTNPSVVPKKPKK